MQHVACEHATFFKAVVWVRIQFSFLATSLYEHKISSYLSSTLVWDLQNNTRYTHGEQSSEQCPYLFLSHMLSSSCPSYFSFFLIISSLHATRACEHVTSVEAYVWVCACVFPRRGNKNFPERSGCEGLGTIAGHRGWKAGKQAVIPLLEKGRACALHPGLIKTLIWSLRRGTKAQVPLTVGLCWGRVGLTVPRDWVKKLGANRKLILACYCDMGINENKFNWTYCYSQSFTWIVRSVAGGLGEAFIP